jgi:hypothetical protein
VQTFVRAWHTLAHVDAADTFADPYSLLDFLVDLHNGMAAELPDEQLEIQFALNVRLLEHLAGQLVTTVIESLAGYSENEAVISQIQSWQAEPFLVELIAIYQEEEKVNPIDSSWITLGQQRQKREEVAR